MVSHPHISRPAGGPEASSLSLPFSADLEQKILSALRRDAGAEATCLWRRVEAGMRLDAASPADLPCGEIIKTPGGILGEVADSGAMRLFGPGSGSLQGDAIPLLGERLPAGPTALLPLSGAGIPAAALVSMHWTHLPYGAEDRLFAWSRWARLLETLPAAPVPPARVGSPSPAAEGGGWPAAGESLPFAAGALARRMRERLSAVLPSLHRAIGLTDESAPALRFLLYVEEGLDRTFHLLARLAAFSGSAPLLVETMSLADCAAETIRRLEPERPSGVRLTAEIPRGLPAIVADRVQVTDALIEVTRNALEAAPDGTAVSVECAAEPDGITVTIRDEGPGMTAEVLERAVHPFYSTRHPSRHAGLGLATVQGCVDRHGGTLSISSGVGQGTRVRIWFPVRPEPPAE